jgi:GTP-binding protein LepA
MNPQFTRNFAIIAHIDHGKSTLADRLIEITSTIPQRQMRNQVLDQMDIERERGITIKLQPIQMQYRADDGNTYVLNLIDTPGHVDFSYEVSRSLAAAEGVLLVIDASQGIEAQTLAHAHLAQETNLRIIPVINKIDLPTADINMVKEELKKIFNINPEEAVLTSAKEGTGTKNILETIIKRIPPPIGEEKKPLRALIFDSIYDSYRGVIVFVRVLEGQINAGEKIILMGTQQSYEVSEVGVFKPHLSPQTNLCAGNVGYVIAGIKSIRETTVGDTITSFSTPATTPFPGYKKLKAMVFCGFYPSEGQDFNLLEEGLEKLHLNDSALTFEKETSSALGFGFRCGFLGLLHLEITLERLQREFDLSIVATVPNCVFKVKKRNGEEISIDNPLMFPERSQIEKIYEPFLKVSLFTPSDYVGPIMKLAESKRGNLLNMEYLNPLRAILSYDLPLMEVIVDFFDQLKSNSKGYASMDYEFSDYKESSLVKLEILLNHEAVDAFTIIVHKDNAYRKAREIALRLKELIPQHQFAIPIQAKVEGDIVARETVRTLRKDVIAKCYGGDVSRKMKLLNKQKAGKKKMQQIGKVSIPQETFLKILKIK